MCVTTRHDTTLDFKRKIALTHLFSEPAIYMSATATRRIDKSSNEQHLNQIIKPTHKVVVSVIFPNVLLERLSILLVRGSGYPQYLSMRGYGILDDGDRDHHVHYLVVR